MPTFTYVSRKAFTLLEYPFRPEPLVNIYSDRALIEIKSDEEAKKAIITRESVFVDPLGDDRFLITSILSPESEVLVRISERNISWLVDKLSLADMYEKAKKFIRGKLLYVKLNLDSTKKRIHETESIRQTISKMRSERERLLSEIRKLEEEAWGSQKI